MNLMVKRYWQTVSKHRETRENSSQNPSDQQQADKMAVVDDPLLDEIAQSLDETERTGGSPVSMTNWRLLPTNAEIKHWMMTS